MSGASEPRSAPARVGILGLGSIGASHAQALAELPERAQVVAVSGGGSGDVPGWPGARRESPEGLLAARDLDLLAIASPSELHAEQAIAAMESGIGAVVEKPIATTTDSATAVLQAARRSGAGLYPIAQRRLEEQHVAILDLLDAGDLGELILAEVRVHWHRDAQYYAAAPWRQQAPGGGSMINQGLHSIDMLSAVLGPVSSVCAHVATLGNGGQAEDTAVVSVQATSGALGAIVTSTATPPGDPALLTLRTTKGVIELSHTEITRWEIDGVAAPAARSNVAAGSGDPKAIGIAGHVQAWDDILTAWGTANQPAVTGLDAWRTIALIDGAYTSAATRQHVTIPQDPASNDPAAQDLASKDRA